MSAQFSQSDSQGSFKPAASIKKGANSESYTSSEKGDNNFDINNVLSCSPIIQRYEDNSQAALQSDISLLDLFRIYVMEQDDVSVQVAGQNARYTRTWANSDEGLALLRGEIRYRIAGELSSNGDVNLIRWLSDIEGNATRIEELIQDLSRAHDRRQDPDIDEDASAPALVEHGRQGRTMAVRGPARRDPEETEAQYQARNRRIEGRVHAAMDVPGTRGTGVYAPIAGRVVFAGPGDVQPGERRAWGSGYGNIVRIYHPNPPETEIAGTTPLYTHYAHLDAVLVQAGDTVHPGQAIGLMGNTRENAAGVAGSVPPGMGVHVHFAVQVAPAEGAAAGSQVTFTSHSEEQSGINPSHWLSELGMRISDDAYQEPVRRGGRGAVVQRKIEQSTNDTPQNFLNISPIAQSKDIAVQCKPSYLVNNNFLGRNVEVNPAMSSRLNTVETHLQSEYDALPADGRPPSVREYAQLDTIRGWRSGPNSSKHASGSAVDVNYRNQPYIPTRTIEGENTHYGGEEGNATAATRTLRQPAVAVYDRAVAFMRTNPYDDETANVGVQGPDESSADVYERFRFTSDSLASYLSLAFHTNYHTVTRTPITNPETVSESDLLSTIPTSERKEQTAAVAEIQALMDDFFWQTLHHGYPHSADQQYIRILRDYEIVRTPMQRGNPSTTPGDTRNPALGFLHMPEHFVTAMIDEGNMRWGLSTFPHQALGDVHHFDLNGHAGYAPDGSPP